MRVVRSSSDELRYIDKRHIVAPESAFFLIGFAANYGSVWGLEDMRRSIYACTDHDIRDALRRGDWLLIDEKQSDIGFSYPAHSPPPAPVLPTASKEQWPRKKAQGVIFAKSCAPGQWGKADAGTEIEPAEHFGSVMVSETKSIPTHAAPLIALVGADAVLGRIAGGGIHQLGYTWALRGRGRSRAVRRVCRGHAPQHHGRRHALL